MIKKEDRRVKRTKKDLKNAFIILLREKMDVKKISIIDIVELADYNRATFYVHYKDKEELIDEIINESISGFLRALEEPFSEVESFQLENLSSSTIKIFEYIEKNAQVYELLFCNKLFPTFQNRLRVELEKIYLNFFSWFEEDNDINIELYVRGSTSVVVGLIDHWIENKFSYSVEYLSSQLLKIVTYVPSKVDILRDIK